MWNEVANRHVLINSMHIGHTRYTSTVLNIKIQYAHAFYQSYILHTTNVYDNTFAQENVCGVFFVNGNVFFSQHILNKAKIHTQVLFCCLKCPLATTYLLFL